ncbi:hypothetical protein VMCG_10002 [Cytospora schulzeri]|uniref:Uncharacterized protein n=1 Tax=Cytospora schulzeri TaxID=448051 RepID=A0A423VI27_9PEZI|nr:hypothetical protein VMCG_10002 [Valsa malicola]
MSLDASLLMDERVRLALEAHQADDGTGPEIIQKTIAETWVSSFIYQLFVEDVALRQSVIDFVCKYRPGHNPRLGSPYRFGSYNFIIEVIFDDGTALFRFPIPGVVVYPDDKVTVEVATIRYIAEHTTIPVPHVYHWGTAGENPTGLDVPFIIMNYIPHATTVARALEDPDFTISSVPESEKREYLFQQMAEVSLQLYALTSDRIGSLGILDNGEYAVPSGPLTHNIAYQVVNCGVPVAVLPPRARTYSSSTEYLGDAMAIELAGLLFVSETFVRSASDYRDRFAARCLLRDIVRRRGQESTGAPDQPGRPAGDSRTGQPGETFRLWGDDLRPENVLLDENGVVVGVVDWEYTYFAPETYLLNPPWWLLLSALEGGSGEDREPGIPGQEESSPDTGTTGDEQDDDKFEAQWDELVRTYLRAMEKAEEKLRGTGQVQPLGHHLYYGPSRDRVAAAPIAQQPPLSHLIRHRWDEDMKEHALTTCIVQDFLMDRLFWVYVDEPYLGDNTVGGHEGRLAVLNAPSRMLMDWFVSRRVEESAAWDPKALLDQVLEQMDGKSAVLAIQDSSR